MFTAYPQHIHAVLFTITLPRLLTFLFTYAFLFTMWIFFHSYCIIVYSTMFTVRLHWILTVMFTITLPSILSVLFTYAVLFTMWYFSTMTAQLTLQQCLQHILNIYIRYCLQLHYQYTVFAITYAILFIIWYFFTITAQLTLQQCLQHILSIYIRYCLQLDYPVYWLCCLYMLPLHNVTFLHNYCTIYSTTMSTAYPQHIHIVLFATTPHSILALLFIYAFLFTMWYFSTMTAQFTLQQCLQHILNIYIQYCSQLHYPVYWLCCLHMLSFSQCDIFPQWLHNSLYNHVYSISSTYTYGLFTITLPSILSLLLHILSFSQYDIFPQWLHNSLYNNVYSISSTYTYDTVYNYTTQYTVFAITYAILFTIWYFFTITAQLTLQQCLQHILNIYIRYCLQLHYPVYWLCCLYMLPLHNVTFFHNYCTIDSATMSTAYPQHIHIVLFRTTLHSILALLFIYASFTQCDIFSQLLHNWLYNNVYSISSTYTCGTVYNYTTQIADFSVYICFPFHNVNIFPQLLYNCLFHYVYSEATLDTYSTVYNYSPQYTVCAVYMCCPFHNVIFFHNDCTIDSTTMFTAYPQHIHTVLFTITLPSILTLLFIYASFTQCDIFSQLLHNWLYKNV